MKHTPLPHRAKRDWAEDSSSDNIRIANLRAGSLLTADSFSDALLFGRLTVGLLDPFFSCKLQAGGFGPTQTQRRMRVMHCSRGEGS